jgi:hypothetical protein
LSWNKGETGDAECECEYEFRPGHCEQRHKDVGVGVRIDMSLDVRMGMRRVQNIAAWLGAQYIGPRHVHREMVTHWQGTSSKSPSAYAVLALADGVHIRHRVEVHLFVVDTYDDVVPQ